MKYLKSLIFQKNFILGYIILQLYLKIMIKKQHMEDMIWKVQEFILIKVNNAFKILNI